MGGWRETGRNLGLLVLRVMAGLGMAFLHGIDKMSPAHVTMFAEKAVTPMHFPFPMLFAWLNAVTEFGGGILIALGLLTRLTCLPLVFNMCVAVVGVHMAMHQGVAQMEPALTYLTAFVVLLFTGPGAFSLDRVIFGKKK